MTDTAATASGKSPGYGTILLAIRRPPPGGCAILECRRWMPGWWLRLTRRARRMHWAIGAA